MATGTLNSLKLAAHVVNNSGGNMQQNRYQEVLKTIVVLLKQERDHEGTAAVITPSELIDKIAAIASDLTDITEMIYGGP